MQNTAPFVEHLNFKKKWLLQKPFGWIVENQKKKKKKKIESGHYGFWNCYMQVALRKKQYRFFLREAPKITKNKLLLHMLFG